MVVRTRFAPSPTGYLHIGGARTALYSWLHARHHGGQFVLRIEDTDLARSTPEAVNAILEGMAWLGLDYDEGPFYQTRRFDRYREVVDLLLRQGHAYRCYCTREELDALRAEQMARKQTPRYDGRCRARVEPRPGVEPVVRFRNPMDGEVAFDDLILGPLRFANAELDDLIIARADGSPTYNFTVVVDDLDMAISHVVRGNDHVNNTPRQINIMTALGAAPPHYAHVPMILGPDGAKLSKRHGAASVLEYRDAGYLPEALLNYLVRLGWSHGDQEIFSLDEMVRLFDVADVNRAPSAINPGKLSWLNQHYLRACDPRHVARHLGPHLQALGIDPGEGPDLATVIPLQVERAQTLVQLAEVSAFFYRDCEDYPEQAAAKTFKPAALDPLRAAREALAALPEWRREALHGALQAVVERLGVGFGKVGMPLRLAVTGGAPSPELDLTLALLGRGASLRRIDRALAFIERRAGD